MSQIAKARLFHTADKSKLVHEDNDEASFLYANTGDEIPDSASELYGLVDGDLKGAASKTKKGTKLDGNENKGGGTGDAAASAGDDAAKGADASADKAAAQSDNKAVDSAADKAA